MRQDQDDREELIRRVVYECLAERPPVDLSEHVVVTYFVVARSLTAAQVGGEISYHMTSGVRKAPAGSLLAECTGRVVDALEFDAAGRIGLVRVAFPLKMLLDEQGRLFSTDVLHIAAGEGAFWLTENADIKLVHLAMSDAALNKFPGPAYGVAGVRQLTGFTPDEVAFGTILKPCTGITSAEEAKLVAEAAGNPLFLFVKEDENFLPGVPFAPLVARLKTALAAVREAGGRRGGKGLIYAPHVTSPPHLLGDYVRCALEAGVNGLMLSEYFTGGAVRMVRELTRGAAMPPAIYGHNGGISCRTRHIYREVLDLLARLDGVDFRQTAPLTFGRGLLRPYGLEWRQCEKTLSEPLGSHRAVMIARAGGLDQGNIIPNLLDVAAGAGASGYLFLAGSAINGIKNSQGRYDPALGAEAMRQALEVHKQGVFADMASASPQALKAHADKADLRALSTALLQRYGL
jgi:ribulose 1,5-bisphosphate carboxylase large subunit-like protein